MKLSGSRFSLCGAAMASCPRRRCQRAAFSGEMMLSSFHSLIVPSTKLWLEVAREGSAAVLALATHRSAKAFGDFGRPAGLLDFSPASQPHLDLCFGIV